MACSPDGIVSCDTCGNFLVKVKCLWIFRNMHPAPAGVLPDTVSKDDHDIVSVLKLSLVLKKSHSRGYYAQIQLLMAVCQVQQAYVLIWTPVECEIFVVDFDRTFWNGHLSASIDFFSECYVVAELLTERVKWGLRLMDVLETDKSYTDM